VIFVVVEIFPGQTNG